MLYGSNGREWFFGMEDCIRELCNEEGFLQGDGLALWAYIITLHPFLRALQQHVGVEAVIMFFVDDGNVAADFDTMLRVIQFVETEGPKYGYILKKDKGSYLLGKCADPATALHRRDALVAMGFHANIIHIHPDNLEGDEGETQAATAEYGAEMLGSYIGSRKFIKKQVHSKAVELTHLGCDLADVPHAQSAMLLFRYCYCPMINHLMRTVSPRLLTFLVKQFNYCKCQILAAIMGYSGEGLPDRVLKWAEFSLGQGGLGLGNTRFTKHAAFLASVGTTINTVEKFIPNVRALISDGAFSYMADIRDSLAFVRNAGGYTDDAELNKLLFDHKGACYKLQEVLAQKMLSKSYAQYRDSQDLPINDKAWLLSISQYEASLWLEAIPKSQNNTFTDDEFRVALYYRYMLPQPLIPEGTRCTCARRPLLDRLGHHAITGCKCGGGRQNTHDLIKHGFSALFSSNGIRGREEEHDCFRATDPDCGKRPDLTVESGPLYAQRAILDIAVTCPLPGASAEGAAGLSRAQASIQGRAADQAVQRKVSKYRALATANQLHFIPLIFESPGYVHEYTCAFTAKVAEYASKVKLIPQEAIYKYWMTRFSVILQKGLATALVRRVSAAINKDGGYNPDQPAVDVMEQNMVFLDRNLQ
jgi:hypothetical protein